MDGFMVNFEESDEDARKSDMFDAFVCAFGLPEYMWFNPGGCPAAEWTKRMRENPARALHILADKWYRRLNGLLLRLVACKQENLNFYFGEGNTKVYLSGEYWGTARNNFAPPKDPDNKDDKGKTYSIGD